MLESSEGSSKKSSKSKKVKQLTAAELLEAVDAGAMPASKKEKKSKKTENTEVNAMDEFAAAADTEAVVAPVVKKAKRKHAETTSEEQQPVVEQPRKKSKTATGAVATDVAPAAAVVAVDPTTTKDANGNPPISDFPVSPEARKLLAARGITHMFPIQANSFHQIVAGKDVMGRARTGTGKTLAFALPIIEKLRKNPAPKKAGRAPRVLVLAPTRELATQDHEEFKQTGPHLDTLCIYGGTPYYQQEAAMRKGLDVVVGTTGRIKDHIDRTNLKLENIECVILDEADEMLNRGFAEDVEYILASIRKATGEKDRQTLLFSATIPPWIKKLADSFMKKDKVVVDLVVNEKVQAAVTVRHIVMPVHWSERANVLGDIIRCYGGKNGSTIVFAETKKECNELAVADLKIDTQVLHGDIAQNQREITLKGFRDGKFKCLIATDVAARGLDISGVDLVIQLEPPERSETYVHRAGRTGRAGKVGVCVTFYTPKQLYFVQNIEKRTGLKFEHKATPQPVDIVKSSVDEAVQSISEVHKDVIPYFREAAAKLMDAECGVEEVIAKALAVISGHTQPVKNRSLLCSSTDFVTVLMKSSAEIRGLTYVWTQIRRFLFADADDKVRGMRLLKTLKGAVFDVPAKFAEQVAACKGGPGITFEVATALPPLVEQQAAEAPAPRRFGGRSSFGGGGGGGRSFGGGGGRGGGGFGRGGGGNRW